MGSIMKVWVCSVLWLALVCVVYVAFAWMLEQMNYNHWPAGGRGLFWLVDLFMFYVVWEELSDVPT